MEGASAEDHKWAQSVNTCLHLAQISCAYYLNMSESAVMSLPDALFKKDDLKKKLMGVSGHESTPEIDGQIESAHANMERPAFLEENNKDNCWKESRKIAKFDYEQWLEYSGLLIVDSLAIKDGEKGKSYVSNDVAAAIALGNLAATARKMAVGNEKIPKLPIFDKLAESIEQCVTAIARDPNFESPELTRNASKGSKWSLPNSILYDPAKDPDLKVGE